MRIFWLERTLKTTTRPLLQPVSRFFKFLPGQQRQAFLHEVSEKQDPTQETTSKACSRALAPAQEITDLCALKVGSFWAAAVAARSKSVPRTATSFKR